MIVHVACGHGSVVWWLCNILYTYSVVYVMFSSNGPYAGLTLPQQHRSNDDSSTTLLLCGIGCTVCWMIAGAKARWVLHARAAGGKVCSAPLPAVMVFDTGSGEVYEACAQDGRPVDVPNEGWHSRMFLHRQTRQRQNLWHKRWRQWVCHSISYNITDWYHWQFSRESIVI